MEDSFQRKGSKNEKKTMAHKPAQSLPQSGLLRKEFEANQRRNERR